MSVPLQKTTATWVGDSPETNRIGADVRETKRALFVSRHIRRIRPFPTYQQTNLSQFRSWNADPTDPRAPTDPKNKLLDLWAR
jgi:hypothetical protein